MQDPIIKLPPFKIEKVLSSLSQVIDWGLQQYNIPNTWKESQGEGITVYVLDTGCTDHYDIGENVICGGGFISGEDDNDNKSGHSTHVAGIIAAKNNEEGMVGVAPKSKVVTIKVLGDSGTGNSFAISSGLQLCIDAAKGARNDLPKPDIISMSLGASVDLGPEIHGKIKELYNLNVPIICAVGNSGRNGRGIMWPAKYPETIAIGAHDQFKKIADFSSFGPEIDFAAPGVGIYSTYLNNTYAKLSGSSMATPIVSGIVALMLAKHKKQEQETGKNDCKTVQDIKNHLIKYAIDQGPKGKDEKWGYGIIDVPKLISHGEKVEDWKPEQPTFEKSWWQKFLKWFFG